MLYDLTSAANIYESSNQQCIMLPTITIVYYHIADNRTSKMTVNNSS